MAENRSIANNELTKSEQRTNKQLTTPEGEKYSGRPMPAARFTSVQPIKPTQPPIMSNLIDTPQNPIARVLFAHGAGAGQDHPFMELIAQGLKAHRIEVIRFNFPYMKKRQEDGKKRPPDRQPKLLAAFAEEAMNCKDDLPLFLAGKSMGGRMATLLMAGQLAEPIAGFQPERILGLLCLGYPFHAPAKKDQWRADHFVDVSCPCLILQGERDTFGNKEEMTMHTLPVHFQQVYLPDGDHSLKPRKKSEVTEEENINTAIGAMVDFIQQTLS